MALFKRFRAKQYSSADLRDLEQFIVDTYGEYPTVLHEVTTPSLPIDVAVIKPTERHPYYTLITIGFGAYRMNVPRSLSAQVPDRAELILNLPPDWPIDRLDKDTNWPIRFLTEITRLPQSFRTWLGEGHTIPNFENRPFAPETRLNGTLLISDKDSMGMPRQCATARHHNIRFYRVIFLYPEEISYKLSYGPEALLHLMEAQASFEEIYVLHPNRRNFCAAIPSHPNP